mmetsp:Transcript_81100/g.229707  ORF Transcript_81100/g.229707 Transcript_81100/m.229707 type:complete len:255 (-) Transcript_81100:262-1026(-)
MHVLGHLQVRGEHALDESGVPEDLVRLPHKLQLLADLEVGRRFQDPAGGADAEVADLLPASEGHDACVGRHRGPVERHGAVRVLQGILQIAHALLTPIFQREGWHRLEAAPPHGDQRGIATFEHLRVPPVPLDPHLHQAHAALAGQEAAQDDRPLPAHLRDAGRGHVLEAHPNEGANAHAVTEVAEVGHGNLLLHDVCLGRGLLQGPLSVVALALGSALLPLAGGGLRALLLFGAAPAAGDELAALEGLFGCLI